MRLSSSLLLALLALLPVALAAAGTAAPASKGGGVATGSPQRLGLSVSPGGQLLLKGRPYRGCGVNYFDAFARTLERADDRSYEQGFRALSALGIPFARFMASGFWPVNCRLYQTDRQEYFRRLDAVVKSAERNHVGLIASLFWCYSTVPDLVGEPVDQWGNPKSKTHAFMRRYVREVVTRYRRSPALWGWEFGNEYLLSADLPNAADHRPPVAPELGTPASRSARDELSSAMVRVAYREFAREVRRWDPVRVVLSGDGFPRPSAWHQRQERSWGQDTKAQYEEVLLRDTPSPMDLLSAHLYEAREQRFGADCSAEELLRVSMQAARKARKPLFVGEFGANDEKGPDQARERLSSLLQAIEKTRVPLSALWVYDYAGQDKVWNVTASNSRAYQLRAIAETNRRLSRMK